MTNGKLPLISILILTLGGLLYSPGVVRAQKLIFQHTYPKHNKTHISLNSAFDKGPTHGFQSVRVTIKNNTTRDREWRLNFDYSSVNTTTSRFNIQVKAGEEFNQDIFVPVPWHFEHSGYRQEKISISGSGLPSLSHFGSQQFQNYWPNIVISEQLAARNLALLNKHLDDKPSKGGRSSGSSWFAGTCVNNLLPADWRGYIGFDAVMITAGEWAQLRPAVKKAILEWNRFGGILQIYTEPSDRDLDFLSLGFDQKPVMGNVSRTQHSYGTIELHGWDGQNIKLAQTYNTLRQAARRRTDYEGSFTRHWDLQTAFGEKKFNPLMVMLILTVFSVVVGPVNLFSFAGPGRRHRLFITTPLISIVASTLVMGIILFKDGIGGNGRRMLVMNLESAADEKRAYITQEQISRTGVLLGNRFQIQDSNFIASAQLADSQWSHKTDYSNPAQYTFNSDLHGGDWFQSRTEQAQVIQSVQPTRSRIELTSAAKPNQPPRLFSSLEFTVSELFFVGAGGRVWKAKTSPIPPGTAIELEASTKSALNDLWNPHTKALSSGYNTKDSDQSFRRKTRDLSSQAGHFFAISDDPKVGFVETLDSVKWTNADALIFGSVVDRPTSTPETTDDKSAK